MGLQRILVAILAVGIGLSACTSLRPVPPSHLSEPSNRDVGAGRGVTIWLRQGGSLSGTIVEHSGTSLTVQTSLLREVKVVDVADIDALEVRKLSVLRTIGAIAGVLFAGFLYIAHGFASAPSC